MVNKEQVFRKYDRWYGYTKFISNRRSVYDESRINTVLCSIAPPQYLPFNLGANIIDKVVNESGNYIDRHVYFNKYATLTYHSQRPIVDFDIIGISAYMIFQAIAIPAFLRDNGLQPLRKYRSESDPLIVLGGQLFPFINLYGKYVDVACIGEGEEFILALIETVKKSKQNGLSRIDTLREISKIEGAYVPDIKESVNKTAIKDISGSLLNGKDCSSKNTRKVIEVGRGCKWMCNFCSLSRNMYPYRENSIEDLQAVIDTYEKNSQIYPFAPDESTFSKHEELFNYCKDNDYQYYRYNHRVNTVTEKTIADGNLSNRIVFGIDGISQRVLDIVGKGISLKSFKDKAIQIFKKRYAILKLNYVFSYPFETEQDYNELKEFLTWLVEKRYEIQGYGTGELNTMIQLAPTPFIPEPNTPMYFFKINSKIDERFYNTYKEIQDHWFNDLHIPPFIKIQGINSQDNWLSETMLIRLGNKAGDFIYYLFKNQYTIGNFNHKFIKHFRNYCMMNKIKYFDLLDEIGEEQNIYKDINWAGGRFDGQKKNYQIFQKMKHKIESYENREA